MTLWTQIRNEFTRKELILLILLLTLPGILIVAVFQVEQKISTLKQLINTQDLTIAVYEEQFETSSQLQTVFKRQVQEWKNILLRGHEDELYAKYWALFLSEEKQVTNLLVKLKAKTSANNEHQVKVVESALSQHQELGEKYRAALAAYSLKADLNNTFVIDRLVLGIDRPLAGQLEKMTVEYRMQLAERIKNSAEAHTLALQKIIFQLQVMGALILLLILGEILLIIKASADSKSKLKEITQKGEFKFREMMLKDALTGLPNRQALENELERSLKVLEITEIYGALLLLDMDNFKDLNDSKGHATGDLLLLEVSRRLKSVLRDSDIVARFGGDEFVVILYSLNIDKAVASELAFKVGEKILSTINEPYQINQIQENISCSLGITLLGNETHTVSELLKRADSAMYQAKAAGRNQIKFFDQATQQNLESRVTLEKDLKQALHSQELALHYQIQINADHKPIGAEALLRWTHPSRGTISPGVFIPIAEKSGLIVLLGDWVIRTACEQIKDWQKDIQLSQLSIAVNVSVRQFSAPLFVESVENLIKEFDINPAKLKMEVTESLVSTDVALVIKTMGQLRQLGLRFSMDDFGTGYSSLSFLKVLPLDQIKIDQSFVRDIALDENDRAIVRTIIAMAENLNLEVIAEGVETKEQLDFLLANGCKNFQGYLLGRPVPKGEFEIHAMKMFAQAKLVTLRPSHHSRRTR